MMPGKSGKGAALGVAGVVSAALAAACVLWVAALPQAMEASLFEVERGDVLETVAQRLKDRRLVRSKLAFKALARVMGADRIMAGEYEIPARASLWGV
ncbi:MAG: endolytic transglycosylase MltG, partial [Rickettsiales bacterium]|nr:endolytic transglycosylase MltG [Rickettsiales bacterium]